MKAQLYTRTSGAWNTIKTYRHSNANAVHNEVLQLARDRAEGMGDRIGGVRLITGNKVIAHWNVMQGWVEHGTTRSRPLPRPKPQTSEQLKHPQYARPGRESGKQKRLCLRCEKMFPSHGPQNRLCETCRSRGDDDPMAIYSAHLPGGA